MSRDCFAVSVDQRGVLTASLDLPGRGQNVFTDEVVAELTEIVERLETDSTIRVAVFRSGKASGFLAGADVEELAGIEDPDRVWELSQTGQYLFLRIESLSIPTLAVIHGPCLGGGLEFALACRHRVARDDRSTRLGLPEIELGILPGWGGTTRLPRQIGLSTALSMILSGKRLSAAEALSCGLVDATAPVDRFDEEVARFVDELLAGTTPGGPRRGVAQWLLDRTPPGRWLALRTAGKQVRRQARHYPAAPAALDAIRRGLKSAPDGLAAERDAIAKLLFTPTCRNLLGLFFGRERARKTETWVAGDASEKAPETASRVAVVGAGVMGAGIAGLLAHQGFPVVLHDINDDLVSAGRDGIVAAWDQLVSRGRLSKADRDERLARLATTTSLEELGQSDIVIEAVTERKEIKRSVFEELDRVLPPASLIATNTSALSVDMLAAATGRPDRVAGLHFFNPVHRMPLVEVVAGEATSAESLARLLQLVRNCGKTPLVVADRPGFLINKVLFGYFDEAVRMVCEGTAVPAIDQDLRRFGMPMGPLELLDQVGLDVATHVASHLDLSGTDASPTAERLAEMVAEGRTGLKSGRGFYEYDKGTRNSPGAPVSPQPDNAADPLCDDWSEPLTPIQLRLVLPLINGTAGCLDAGVVTEPWMADLGMVLGTGFAPFRGGPLALADAWGRGRVAEALTTMAERHGPRFAPAAWLRASTTS